MVALTLLCIESKIIYTFCRAYINTLHVGSKEFQEVTMIKLLKVKYVRDITVATLTLYLLIINLLRVIIRENEF